MRLVTGVRLFLLLPAVMLLGTYQARSTPAGAAGTLQVIATVPGQPDDITLDRQGRLVWGDLLNGTIDRLQGGRVVTIVRHLSVPEGVMVLPNGDLLVAEQGLDRVDRITTRGVLTVLWRLQPVAGQEGVDGIDYDARINSVIIPDSPRGTILRFGLKSHHLSVVASGLGRPVDAAVDTHGNILVPDEHLGTLVVISPRGAVSHRGSFATPDDVVVDRKGRIWLTSLGDGGLWLLQGNAAPVRVLSGLANPQGLTLDAQGNPVIVDQNSARIVRYRAG